MLCARNERLAQSELVPARPDVFTVDDWRREAQAREHADRVTHADHWRVSVDPGDGKLRTFYLRGHYYEVQFRAQAFFPKPASITIEPSGLAGDIERIDRRLTPLSLA